MELDPECVAVVTGAASGIGRSLCLALGSEGCRIVAADVESEALDRTMAEFHERDIEAVGRITDVADARSVADLAEFSVSTYGAVHVLCNNAGVTVRRSLPETTLDDWSWVLGVNLLGTVHGLQAFLPELRRHAEAHIVTTASVAGLLPFPMGGAYNASKAALVALMETLFLELSELAPQIGLTLLCPGPTRSRIDDAERNRLGSAVVATPVSHPEVTPTLEQQKRANKAIIDRGMDPDVVATQVLNAVRHRTFYVMPHAAEYGPAVSDRVRRVLEGGSPARVPIEHIFGLDNLEEDVGR